MWRNSIRPKIRRLERGRDRWAFHALLQTLLPVKQMATPANTLLGITGHLSHSDVAYGGDGSPLGPLPTKMSLMAELQSIYREHVLSCRPMLLDDGNFQARVAIICVRGNKTMSQRFLDLEVFAVEKDAVERARSAGMDWVDAFRKVNDSSLLAPRSPVINRPNG
jgi:hypothetical protein